MKQRETWEESIACIVMPVLSKSKLASLTRSFIESMILLKRTACWRRASNIFLHGDLKGQLNTDKDLKRSINNTQRVRRRRYKASWTQRAKRQQPLESPRSPRMCYRTQDTYQEGGRLLCCSVGEGEELNVEEFVEFEGSSNVCDTQTFFNEL